MTWVEQFPKEDINCVIKLMELKREIVINGISYENVLTWCLQHSIHRLLMLAMMRLIPNPKASSMEKKLKRV